MNRTLRVLVVTAMTLLCAAAFTSAAAAAKGGKKGGSVKITGASQAGAVKKGVKVTVKGKSKRVRVQLEARTFDEKKYKRVAKTKRVRLGSKGKAKVKLKLTKGARKAFKGCEARTLRAEHSRRLRQGRSDPRHQEVQAEEGRPERGRPLRLHRRSGRLALSAPVPGRLLHGQGQDSATGRRIDLDTEAMPQNENGVAIDAGPYNLNDGFSPGQSIVVKAPGLDTPAALTKTGAVPLSKLSDYTRKKAPVVVIDTTTRERWPIWAEIDAKAEDPSRAALLIHPATNFAAGHRYIVALRNLRSEKGKTLSAPEGFRYYRDDLPSKKGKINSQRKRFESIFKTLRKAKLKRSDLYLAWDFTVASDENIAGRMLKMRDESFAGLGDNTMADLTVQGASPTFQVGTVTNFTLAENANMARRVQGTFQVPCYLAPNCAPGAPAGRFNLGADGLPSQTGSYTANFNCMIPRSAVDGTPSSVRPSLYGHGLLGSANEVTSSPQQTLGNTHGFIFCGTDEIGLSTADVPNAFAILQNLSNFPELVDRLQQGMLNELFLGRLMLHPNGLASNGAFHVDGTTTTPSVINSSRLYYNGNSQGGIEGGALTAVAPDFTRASLGVTGMNYSVLLNRSVDFDQYAELGLEPAYTDELEQPLALSLIQMLWDRGESNGYAHRMTSNPLPNTPPHEVLMNVGFGDHQVSTFTADTQARTIGASVHAPVVYDGRWPGVEQVWGVPRIQFGDGGPYDPNATYAGSALVYWDSGPVRDDPSSADPADVLGTDPPPIANLPNRSGEDPHELPRRTAAEQQMVSDFLRPNALSRITDTCGGGPCFDFTFSGP